MSDCAHILQRVAHQHRPTGVPHKERRPTSCMATVSMLSFELKEPAQCTTRAMAQDLLFFCFEKADGSSQRCLKLAAHSLPW